MARTAAAVLVLGITAGTACASSYYVATNGSDGNDGSISRPFATIQKAMNTAIAGDEVLLRGGTYRQFAKVALGHSGAAGAYITVGSYNGEQVVIKGSDVVTGWVRYSGNVWKKSGWNKNSQQVFDDGAPLQQIGMPSSSFTRFEYPDAVGNSIADMAPGRFYYDGSTLYVQLSDNSDPNGSLMEASTRRRIFFAEPDRGYIRLQNLIFMHSNGAAYTNQEAAVTVSSNSIVDHCTVKYADLAGLSLGWATQGVQVLDSTFSHNGQLGIQAPGSKDITLRDNVVTDNNYRNFNPLWHAGGIKTTTQSYGLIEHNEVGRNRGSGIWADYDTSANATVIRGNYVHDNGPMEAGVLFEASKHGAIYNNVVVGNERRGIYISGSNDVRVYNNTVIGTSGLAGIEVGARDGVASTDARVKNNIIYNTTAATDLDMSSGIGNSSDHNNIYRASGSIVLKYDGIDYSTLSLWQSVLGLDTHSLNVDPRFNAAAGDDYAVQGSSPVVDAGVDLTSIPDDYRGDPRPAGAAYDIGAYERTAAGVAGQWMFDENSGSNTADVSGNGNTGTLANGVAWTSPGKEGAAALRFDGLDDFVNAGNGPSLTIASDLTVAGWFKHSSSGGANVSGIDKLGSFRLTAQQANAYASNWQFLVKGASGAIGNVTTTYAVSNDQWHHIAGVYDRSAGLLHIYVDGVEATAPVSFSGGLAASGLPLLIGRRDGSAYYAGAMDDVRLYNRALTGTEIADLAGAGTSSAEVILDNRDSGVTLYGSWRTSSYTSGYQVSDYLHDQNSGKGGKSVEFTPTLSAAGTYKVYAKWTSESNRASNTPIDIVHAGGMDTLIKNQRVDGGQWVLLGRYYFNAGTGGSVLIRNDGTDGYVIADAVRFVPVSSP